jgi:hypothetical protein
VSLIHNLAIPGVFAATGLLITVDESSVQHYTALGLLGVVIVGIGRKMYEAVEKMAAASQAATNAQTANNEILRGVIDKMNTGERVRSEEWAVLRAELTHLPQRIVEAVKDHR